MLDPLEITLIVLLIVPSVALVIRQFYLHRQSKK